MAQANFTNVLPDPNNGYNDAGQDVGSHKGPGFASVKLSSKNQIMQSRTNSGRYIAVDNSHHRWEINISYNPMTRNEFSRVYSFLLQKRSFLKPFYVSLPQYTDPSNSTFAASGYKNSLSPNVQHSAGSSNMEVTALNYNQATHGTPKPGDLFTVSDPLDSNHEKAYKITHVETPTDYQDSVSISNACRIHFMPPLQRTVGSGATLQFGDPLVRVVINSEVQEYSLGQSGLYEFSLKLQEVQK